MTTSEREIIELEAGWEFMQKGITKLKNILEGVSEEQFNPEEYMRFYETVYKMCTQKPPHDYSQQLYDRYRESFEDYITSMAVPGCDAAGVVVEVGDGVSKIKIGDEVYSDIQNFTAGRPKQLGTLAQYTVVEEHLVAPKPTNLSFEEAASLPLAVLTAQEAFDIAKFEKGQSVFIVGGAGGVGSLAIQLAKHVYGASRIVSTASTGKLDFVKSLGADLVIDYTKQSYDQISEKFDFVFDTIGESAKSHVVAKEEAKVLDIASFQPHPRAEFFLVSPSGHNLEKLQPYIESEKLKPVIDPKSPYSFSDVIEAFKHQESGRARGKIVISPIE